MNFNASIPSITNAIADDVPDIEENFEFLWAMLGRITGGAGTSAVTHLMVGNAGDFNRSKIVSASDATITLTAAKYHHAGDTDQMVYWADTGAGITFTVGSGGSNNASDDLGADEWHYIYLDDSAIKAAGTNIISNLELLNDTTAPTWNGAKYGWYNGNDRCIRAFYSDSDSDILEFFHDGGDLVLNADATVEYSSDLDTSWIDVTLTIPACCCRALCVFQALYADGSTSAYWRTNGQTSTFGHYAGSVSTGSTKSIVNTPVITDSSQKIEVKLSASGGNTLSVSTEGYFLPTGM